MRIYLSRLNRTWGTLASPLILVIVAGLVVTWILIAALLGVSSFWTRTINLIVSILTIFILWRIQMKQKREAKKFDELAGQLKQEHQRMSHPGNGFKSRGGL